MPRRSPALMFIFITVVLDVMGFGLLIPVGPHLVQSLLHRGAGGTEAEAAPVYALLQSTWYGMSFLFASVLGGLSDRFGRRPVILIALFGTALDFFAQGLSTSLTVLFITRAINGMSGASFTVATAYIADVTPPEKRAGAFGMMGAAFGLGFVVGPLVGGFLGSPDTPLPFIGHGGIRIPFFVAGALTLINAIYGVFILPESLPPERRAHFHLRRAHPIAAYARLRHYPLVMGLAAATFLWSLAQFGLHTTWVLYTGQRFLWGPRAVGLSLFFVGVGAAVVQGGLAAKIVPKLGERRSLMFGTGLAVFTFLGYGLATHGWMIYAIIIVGSIGAIAQPAAQALITRSVGPTEQGAIQGTLASLQSLAGIIGPLIGGLVFGYFAPKGIPGAPFFVGAFLMAAGWAIAAWAMARVPERPGQAGMPVTAPSPGAPPAGASPAATPRR